MPGDALPRYEEARWQIHCVACKARRDGLCRNQSATVLRELACCKTGNRTLAAGQALIAPGQVADNLYNLVEGWAFVYHLAADGSRQILHFALPGAVLGSVTPDPHNHFGVQALTDAVVCVMPQPGIERLLQARPALALRLTWLVTRDRSLAYDHLASVGRLSARQRIARLLLELAMRYRTRQPLQAVGELALPLTQEHIGDAMGLSAVHVNRVLRKLYQEGILSFHHRRLRILDTDRLWAIADPEPQTVHAWTRAD